MLRKIASAVLLVLIAGCATPLSPQAEGVQVHSQVSNLLENCKKLGPVTATAGAGVVYYEQHEAAKNGLREATAHKGGDTVAIINIDERGFRKIVTMQGIAMKCY